MKILLIGASGQVGWELRRTLLHHEVIPVDRHGFELCLDLADRQATQQLLEQVAPDVIINAAAYTQVDTAESDKEAAFNVNAEAPAILADYCSAQDALLVHFSTDYVFDGTSEVPYVETDEPNPLGVYGDSKLEGDTNIQSSGADHLIFRTSWVYSSRQHNFLKTMTRLLAERDELSVVSDQHGTPTWARYIAESVALILNKYRREQLSEFSGIYNLTASGQTTWFGFAQEIQKQMAAATALIRPIPTSQYPTPARRPGFSVLSNSRLEQVFGFNAPDWKVCVELCMQEMPGASSESSGK